jgi:hypothetical protein
MDRSTAYKIAARCLEPVEQECDPQHLKQAADLIVMTLMKFQIVQSEEVITEILLGYLNDGQAQVDLSKERWTHEPKLGEGGTIWTE